MLEILYLLSSKENYEKYAPLIDPKVLTKEVKLLVEDISTFYGSMSRTEIDWDEFETWFCVIKHSSFKEDTLNMYKQIFNRLKTYIPTETYEEIVQALIKREFAVKIADKALNIADGTVTDIEAIQELMDDYTKKHVGAAAKIEFEEMPSFEDIHDDISSAGAGLDWRLDFMNTALGPVRKGDFIIVGKRPETGGTTFVVSECTHMAAQLSDDRPVLYIANEESEMAIRHRIKQAAIGRDMANIMFDKDQAEKDYIKAVGSSKRIQLKHKAGVSIHDIRGWIEAYNPGLIIVDQLWKVMGFHKAAGGEVQRLTMIFQEARRWAQEYAPVIAVHQADGTADNERYLHYNQLYMSKTGVQGEADAIVMIGATDEVGFEHTRFINIPKNKLVGGPSTDEAQRHGKQEVRIFPDKARFSKK